MEYTNDDHFSHTFYDLLSEGEFLADWGIFPTLKTYIVSNYVFLERQVDSYFLLYGNIILKH